MENTKGRDNMNPLLKLYLRMRYGQASADNPVPYAEHFQRVLATTVQAANDDTNALRLAHKARMAALADDVLRTAVEVSGQIRGTTLNVE